ncbi:MAG TPA: hypothetical protein VGH28_34030 [Polyangiaceae bacterium]
MNGRLARIACIVCAGACSGPPSSVPAAIMNATPSSVCAGDHFATSIHLDSQGSSPVLTLVYSPPAPDAGAIHFAWSFSGAVCTGIPASPGDWTTLGGQAASDCDVLIDPGSVDALGDVAGSDVILAIAGDRPVDVTLVVTSDAGGTLTARRTISITALDDAGACPLPKAN